MGKKSNGKLRQLRLVERALRKGVDLSAPAPTDGYAYVYGLSGTHLTARKG
jgi:hypothetical protein